jgi:hypothetical protein
MKSLDLAHAIAFLVIAWFGSSLILTAFSELRRDCDVYTADALGWKNTHVVEAEFLMCAIYLAIFIVGAIFLTTLCVTIYPNSFKLSLLSGQDGVEYARVLLVAGAIGLIVGWIFIMLLIVVDYLSKKT